MLDEHGFGDHGTRAAGTGQSGDRRQQMQKQDGQIAHGTIMPTREIQEMLRIWQFAMHTTVFLTVALFRREPPSHAS